MFNVFVWGVKHLQRLQMVQRAPVRWGLFGAIVTENVTVFRGDEQDGYCFLPAPFTVSIVAVAAFNCHNYVPPGETARAPATAKLPDGRLVLTDEV